MFDFVVFQGPDILALLLCIEHCFAKIKFHTLYAVVAELSIHKLKD